MEGEDTAGGNSSCGGRKELVWAVAGCNCNGLRKTSAGSFLLVLYPGPRRRWAGVAGGAGGDATEAQPGLAVQSL